MTYTLTLTDEQAEILGYALTVAKRSEIKKAADPVFRPFVSKDKEFRARAAKIEELRGLLDTCPASVP